MPKVDGSGSGAEGGGVAMASVSGAAGIAPGGPEDDPSHTRNSSTTSQASAGYSSQNSQPGGQHSRQSSSGGESSHGRYGII